MRELSPLLAIYALALNRLSHQNLLILHHLIIHLVPRYHHLPHLIHLSLAQITAMVQSAYQVTAGLKNAEVHPRYVSISAVTNDSWAAQY
jgi:hypothetical protein